jgi:hypothetical protein
MFMYVNKYSCIRGKGRWKTLNRKIKWKPPKKGKYYSGKKKKKIRKNWKRKNVARKLNIILFLNLRRNRIRKDKKPTSLFMTSVGTFVLKLLIGCF